MFLTKPIFLGEAGDTNISDLNTAPKKNFSLIVGDNISNCPISGRVRAILLYAYTNGGSYGAQILIDCYNASTRIYYRGMSSTTWMAWKEMSTVSQQI